MRPLMSLLLLAKFSKLLRCLLDVLPEQLVNDSAARVIRRCACPISVVILMVARAWASAILLGAPNNLREDSRQIGKLANSSLSHAYTGRTKQKLESQARLLTGTADAMRLALPRRPQWMPSAHELYNMPEAAGSF